MRDEKIIARLNAISSAEDETQVQELQELVDSIVPSSLKPELFRALFGIFERFPESDGLGVFWAILHLLEACNGYEPFLLESVRRSPCEFNLNMVNRILNSGVAAVSGVDLLSILVSVRDNPTDNASARTWARKFVLHQEKRKGTPNQAL